MSFMINPYWFSAVTPSTGFGFKYGYQFDGVDEYINFGNNLNLESSDSFSFSFWINPSKVSDGVLLSNIDVSLSFRGYEIRLTSGKVRFILINTLSTVLDVRTVDSINLYDWVNISICYNGDSSANNVDIYIDGVLKSKTITKDTLSGTIVNNEDFCIGIRPQPASAYFGRIDDVQIFDYKLTSTNASDIYNSGYVTAPTASPIHHWKLGEEDTFSTNWTVNDSIGSLGGISVNMEETDRKLGVGYSMAFDGVDEEISFPNHDISGAFSVSAWFKLSDTGNNVIISDWGSGTKSWMLTLASGEIQFFTSDDGTSEDFLATTLTYNDNSWHNVLVTFGSTGGTRIYLDGSLVNSASTYYVVYNSSNNLLIGNYAFSGNNFNGNLMEISIFDSELSASDATLLYNTTGTLNGVPIDPRNVGLSPTFYVPLVGPNDSFSTNWTITDEINGNNGTSVNMEEADKTSETP